MPMTRTTPAARTTPWPAACALLLLTVVALGSPRPAPAADDPPPPTEFTTAPLATEPPAPHDLRELLATVDARQPLRVSLAAGTPVEGHPWRVVADTLLLVPPQHFSADGGAPAAAHLRRVPLAEIVRVQQRHSAAAGGARWGTTSGVVVGGTLGLLFGVAIASINNDDDGPEGPIIGGALVGSVAGALFGRVIGAGIGLMTHDWYTIHPRSGERTTTPTAAEPSRTRLHLEPCFSFGRRGEIDGGGPGARIGVLRRIGSGIEMGPVIEYHLIGADVLRGTSFGTTYLTRSDPLLAVGLDLRLHGAGARLRPFGAAGVGWSISNDLFLGAHLGGGLRWRDAGGRDYSLGLRHHFELVGGNADDARFWSLGAGISFGL